MVVVDLSQLSDNSVFLKMERVLWYNLLFFLNVFTGFLNQETVVVNFFMRKELNRPVNCSLLYVVFEVQYLYV